MHWQAMLTRVWRDKRNVAAMRALASEAGRTRVAGMTKEHAQGWKPTEQGIDAAVGRGVMGDRWSVGGTHTCG